jgi:hypothetical protein
MNSNAESGTRNAELQAGEGEAGELGQGNCGQGNKW